MTASPPPFACGIWLASRFAPIAANPICCSGAVSMSAHWEHFPHDADVGVRGVGATKAQAFEQAALALTAVVTDLQSIEPQQAIEVECEAPDDELLLADWLNSLIYEMAARRMLFSRFSVQVDGHHLRGQSWGESVDPGRHHPAVEIKGATYTSLRVGQE